MAKRLPPKLSRKGPTIEPKMSLYVFCEGKNTEPQYLLQFARSNGNKLVKVIPSGAAGAPYTLVNNAVEKKKELDIKARRNKDSFSGKFEVWGVFDIDDHPRVTDAKKLAAQNQVKLGISNPCFELWGILHFSLQDAPIHRHNAQRQLVDLMPNYDPYGAKLFDYELIKHKYNEAKDRAERLEKNRKEEGSEGANPSTDIYNLLDTIIENGKLPSKG